MRENSATEPADQSDLLQEYSGHHMTWCTNHDGEFEEHSQEEPYCSRLVHGVDLIPEGDVVSARMWVMPTRAYTSGFFTPAEHASRERLYQGIELTIESWRGPGSPWDDSQRLRLTSDVARSLAAALIVAADLEQGLTRQAVGQ